MTFKHFRTWSSLLGKTVWGEGNFAEYNIVVISLNFSLSDSQIEKTSRHVQTYVQVRLAVKRCANTDFQDRLERFLGKKLQEIYCWFKYLFKIQLTEILLKKIVFI